MAHASKELMRSGPVLPEVGSRLSISLEEELHVCKNGGSFQGTEKYFSKFFPCDYTLMLFTLYSCRTANTVIELVIICQLIKMSVLKRDQFLVWIFMLIGQEESSLSLVTPGNPLGFCCISRKHREDLMAADTLTCYSSIKSWSSAN